MGVAGTVSREVAAPSQPLITEAYDLWLSARGRAAIPKHRDMGAGVLKAITPYVYIIDILNDGTDYRFRFMGSAIAKSIGMDLTGRKMSDAPTHSGAWRSDVYGAVYKRGEPVFTQVSLQDFDRGHILTECALLPLANKDDEFSMLLCVAIPVN